MNTPSPLTTSELLQRESPVSAPTSNHALLSIADIKLQRGDQLSIVRDKDFEDVFHLKCPVGPEGMPARPRKPVKGIKLDTEMARNFLEVRELDGMIPSGSAAKFRPNRAKLTKVQETLKINRQQLSKDPKTGELLDAGGTIFGTDDRFLFNDRSFPWRTTGLIRTAGGFCSGTTIGPRLVLTASHCVNWTDDGAGWITFTPGYFDGDEPWGEIAATNIIYWTQATGLLSDQETAFDYVVLVMEENIGNVVGYPGYRTYNDDWNGGTFWQSIGYPGELASGMRPAFQGDCVISSTQQQSLGGNDGLVLGHFNDFTPGQSGGPVWGWWDNEPWPRVVGVGSTIGSTAVQRPTGSTTGDNEYGGGPALSSLISWARNNFPPL